MNVQWDSKQPKQEGWYVYREHSKAPPEIVHFWWVQGGASSESRHGSATGWPPAYGFARGRPMLLAKRMHTDVSHVEEGLGGQYLCNASTRLPEPLNLELAHVLLAEAKTPRRKKATKKIAIEQVGGEMEGESADG